MGIVLVFIDIIKGSEVNLKNKIRRQAVRVGHYQAAYMIHRCNNEMEALMIVYNTGVAEMLNKRRESAVIANYQRVLQSARTR